MNVRVSDYIVGGYVCTISSDCTVQEAAIAMLEGDCSALIVTEDGKSAIGIVTERDLTRKVVAEGVSKEEKIGDICTRTLEVAPSDLSIKEVLSLMHKNKLRHLPIIHEGRIEGLVSMRDLYEALEKDLKNEMEEIQSFVFADRYAS